MHWVVRIAQKGAALIDQGQDRSFVSVFLSGWAFRYQTLPDGKRQILDFLLPGALIGFGSGETNWYGVETVTNCTVASLPLASFYRLLSECPPLAIRVAECVAMSEMRAHEHMTTLGRRNARERVAALIIELTSRTQLKKLASEANALELPITQVMIGDALGLSNEHVCRTLARLAEDGVLELNRHALRVLDPVALAEEAGVDIDVPQSQRKQLALAA
jgi:CRP-like cAMP-binding protein